MVTHTQTLRQTDTQTGLRTWVNNTIEQYCFLIHFTLDKNNHNWYSPLQTHTGYTTINRIINVLVPIIEFNCYYFGYCLNISEKELNKLTRRHSTDNKELMRRILLSWNDADGRVSWGKVVQALDKSGQPQLASMIKKCYINNDTETSSTTDCTVYGKIL